MSYNPDDPFNHVRYCQFCGTVQSKVSDVMMKQFVDLDQIKEIKIIIIKGNKLIELIKNMFLKELQNHKDVEI